MQTVKFSYSGSATRKLSVMGREQVIVSGDDNSTQFVFKFPESYQSYTKEIVWSGFVLTNAQGEEVEARYLIDNDQFYVPQSITIPNSGKEIEFQIILYKPQNEEDPSSFQITETSLLFPVYISKTAKSVSVQGTSDSISQLIHKAYITSAFDVDSEQDRPVIVFSSLLGTEFVLTLDMPYLDEINHTIPQQFLPPGSYVKVFNVQNKSELQQLTANPPDLAIIQNGSGVGDDYTGNIFVKKSFGTSVSDWTVIYSQQTVDEIQPIKEDIQENAGNIHQLDLQLDSLGDRVSVNEGNITGLQTNLDIVEGQIGTEQTQNTILYRIKTNEDDISGVSGRLSTAETKLDTIETGAEVNVQSDWTENDSTDDQYIKNKPTLGTASSLDQTQVSTGPTDEGKVTKLNQLGKLDESLLNPHVSSVNNRTGDVTLTKSDVGLQDTDNGAKAPVDNLTSTTNPPLASTVKQGLDEKVQKNADIVGGTYTKITYDTKGLVTQGQSLDQADIPNIPATKITTGTMDIARLPQNLGVVYQGSIVQDGVSTSWTYPSTPYDVDVASVSVRDQSGNEVRFGIQYGNGNITLSTAEPPAQGTTFTFKLIAPTQ